MNKQILATALLGISLAGGCSDDSGPTGPPASTLPQTIHGTVGPASPDCNGSGALRFPCERFSIVSPRRGTLVARLSWPERNTSLWLGAGSRDYVEWIDYGCTWSSCETRVLVGAGGTTVLAVALEPGRSGSTSQTFDVNVSLE